MDTLGSRISEAISGSGLNQSEIARRVGVSRQAVNLWIAGTNEPDLATLRKIASLTKRSMAWIVGDKMNRGGPALAQAPRPDLVEVWGQSSVPVIDAKCGAGARGDAAPEDALILESGLTISKDREAGAWSLPTPYLRQVLRVQPDNAFIIEIVGSSMTPALNDGEHVLVDTGDRNPTPPGLFVLWDGFGLVAKQLERIPKTEPLKYLVSSVNKLFKADELTEEEVHIVGRIRWVARRP